MNHVQSPAFSQVDAQTGLAEIAELVTRLAERLQTGPNGSLAQEVVRATCDLVPAVRWCSITVVRPGGFKSLVTSDEIASRVDAAQYEAGSGPCVDAAVDDNVYLSGDLTQERRWPEFTEAASSAGVRSVLAYRLKLVGDERVDAALNLYSDDIDAFDEGTRWMALLLATHAALAVSVALSNTKAQNLERALQSNRRIGTAIGVLMAMSKVSTDEAFGLLRLASQDTNRKLVDIADEVIETGVLPLRHRPEDSVLEAVGEGLSSR